MFYIYKLTCLKNGKGYIGASNSPKRRLVDHKSRMRLGSQLPIHCAMRKYGIESFQLNVLYASPDKQHVFGTMESKFIQEEHTLISEFGYNLTEGGEGLRASYVRKPHTEETKEKMRLAQLGRRKSEEHKQHMKDAKATPEAKEHMRLVLIGNQRSVGYHQTNLAKEAIRQSRIGKHPTEESRLKMSIAAKKRCSAKKIAVGG